MSPTQDFEQRIADYYAAATPARAPDWVLEQILASVETTTQRRTGLGRWWRVPTMPTTLVKLGVTAVGIAVVGVVGLTLLRPPSVGPATRLGIFAPAAGRIVYSDSGLWAVDPSAPSISSRVRLDHPDGDMPLGWSSDGTELLFRRRDPADGTFPYAARLYILHADGSETQLFRDATLTWDATIAPDGSRVVFAAADDVDSGQPLPSALFVVDAAGGRPVRIAPLGHSPTFSPDGTQIAYLVDGDDGGGHVWVANVDGSGAHEILAIKPTAFQAAENMAWSPAGDRIAMDNTLEGNVAIYTFAPDGSGFTKVITNGMKPYWSPDGSRIAYLLPYGAPLGQSSPGLAVADADGSDARDFGFGASGPWHPGVR